MKHDKILLILGYSVLALILVICAASVITFEDKAGEQLTVKGKVIIDGWDDNGNVLGASLFVSAEKDYMIIKDKKGSELFQLDYVDVEVTGIISEDSYGNKTIRVIEYKISDKSSANPEKIAGGNP